MIVCNGRKQHYVTILRTVFAFEYPLFCANHPLGVIFVKTLDETQRKTKTPTYTGLTY
jgi:hypothetical protein